MHSFVSLRKLNSLIAASLREPDYVIAASPQESSTLIFVVCCVLLFLGCPVAI